MTVLIFRLKVLKNGQRSLSRQSIIIVAVSLLRVGERVLANDHGTCPATDGGNGGLEGF